MEFRPCIDIHNGKVKQIVGATLEDEGDAAAENFVSEKGADFFAKFYQEEGLYGGHVILLNKSDSPYYEATKAQALAALRAFPKGLQVGGGITAENAAEFLAAGASHVIVTSYVFRDGEILYENLEKLVAAVGKEHIVLDLSCKKRHANYYIVTDRWQNYTHEQVTVELLEELSKYCDEFLIHAADVEGQKSGIDEELVEILAEYDGIPVTYAGGVGSYDDILDMKRIGRGKINLTIGSALDLFGGTLNYETVRTFFYE
ncbi:MAG: phosphoribosylformimino-5-aminoimidazole carboxamide ribotide isomerase [Lachnospiraceae bacterium]|jgi:phosphoribosylformimino-5-aminoimidazole carboxamide ribotide isomerase|nr:phosphoribosylformimino-5-aminoimidazole carboxamide ribotide isomerase [Lachnospiraceae bacterium]